MKLLEDEGAGSIVYSPLSQGLLTNQYLDWIPEVSRAGKNGTYLKERVQQYLPVLRALNTVAKDRGQSLAQMATSWVLR